jgi:mRNA interferase RelE/StbE
MFEVLYKKRALKGLARMPAAQRERAREALALLAANPDRQDQDVKPLHGRTGFRLRIGDWRLIYEVDRGRLVILVVEIGPRGDVYK